MKKRRKIVVYTRIDEEDVKKIDDLIDKKIFDDRASFIRRAVIDKLAALEPKILA